jgi:tetratricopeptide (TPR) repeat protein
MIMSSVEIIRAHPLLGVGAGNFGLEVNTYRKIFSDKDPNSVLLAQAEMETPERAHNEYIQIETELGIVGGVIFLWFLIGIAIMAIRSLAMRGHMPIHLFACWLGIAMFLLSSIVTSYSFRLIQNGFVFFVVLAIGVTILARRAQATEDSKTISTGSPKLLYAFGAAACLLLGALSAVRMASAAYTVKANSIDGMGSAIQVYDLAMSIDNENPEAPYFLGLRLLQEGRYSEAATYLQRSIDIGKARSPDYSYLATAQSLAGDLEGAVRTQADAVRMYPRSTFVITRYASVLDAAGQHEESAKQVARAQALNKRAANSWWSLMHSGGRVTSELAFKNKDDYMEVMDLKPFECIFAVVDERDILFPNERQKAPWEKHRGSDDSRSFQNF